jgi:hypothetical protein
LKLEFQQYCFFLELKNKIPTTTAFLPLISTLYLSNNSMTPFGVQGINKGVLPIL